MGSVTVLFPDPVVSRDLAARLLVAVDLAFAVVNVPDLALDRFLVVWRWLLKALSSLPEAQSDSADDSLSSERCIFLFSNALAFQ